MYEVEVILQRLKLGAGLPPSVFVRKQSHFIYWRASCCKRTECLNWIARLNVLQNNRPCAAPRTTFKKRQLSVFHSDLFGARQLVYFHCGHVYLFLWPIWRHSFTLQVKFVKRRCGEIWTKLFFPIFYKHSRHSTDVTLNNHKTNISTNFFIRVCTVHQYYQKTIFIIPTDAHNYKIIGMLKTVKIPTIAPTWPTITDSRNK